METNIYKNQLEIMANPFPSSPSISVDFLIGELQKTAMKIFLSQGSAEHTSKRSHKLAKLSEYGEATEDLLKKLGHKKTLKDCMDLIGDANEINANYSNKKEQN